MTTEGRRLRERVAVVTGSGRGIGKAAALTLAREGASVAVATRTPEHADRTASEIRDAGGTALPVPLDVSDRESVEEMRNRVLERFGRVDILVNVAGLSTLTPLEDLEEDEWDRVLAVNLKGVYLCARAVLPAMMEQRYGRIVSVASIAGRYGRAQMSAAYSASKAGVLGFTRSVAKRYGEYGITANAIAPGTIVTDMNRDLPRDTLDRLMADAAVPRLGEVDDVAEAIRFLVTQEAGWITGVTLDINGGTIIA